ncbi:hypothetical protein [Paraburkholderia sacchari]|uniref:hypothetical protein n=1 Tax=Paraburkholderia sacchari TaxID=159450 RepID=UPI0039A4634E
MHDIFAGNERLQWLRAGRRTQVYAAFEQALAQDGAELAGRAGQCNLLHSAVTSHKNAESRRPSAHRAPFV